MAGLIFLFICQIFAKGELKIKLSKTLISLLALLGIFLLSTIFSSDRTYSLFGNPYRSGGFINFAFCILFALLTFLILRKSDWPKLLNFSIMIGIVVSIIAIFQKFGILERVFLPTESQPWSTIGGSTFLAIYLSFLIFLVLNFLIKSIGNFNRKWFFYFPVLLLFIFVILLTGSRAVYIGLSLGMLYFFLIYPSKDSRIKKFKLVIAVLAFLSFLFVAYVNIFPDNIPSFISQNKLAKEIIPRFSFKAFFDDPRFSVWRISSQTIISKPILGYGPENFSIGFDRYYDPRLPKMMMTPGSSVPTSWYDRAHSVIFETGATNGIPALLIYLGLFIFLFLELRQTKKNNPDAKLTSHSLQSAFIAYFIANIFSFDVFSTYLIFFLMLAFSLSLINENRTEKAFRFRIKKIFRYPLIIILLAGLIWFVWTYNIKPFEINTEINKAVYMSEHNQPDKAVEIMEKILPSDTFLNEYLRANYIDIINGYIIASPNKTIILAPKGIRLAKENTEIRPYYTRYWLMLGTYYNLMLENYQDSYPEYAEEWKKEAIRAFEKAAELSPKRQELFLRWAKTYSLINDFAQAEEKIGICIELNPKLGDCYWTKAFIEFKENKPEEAGKDIEIAEQNGYPVDTNKIALLELRKAYVGLKNNKEYIPQICSINYKLLKIQIDKLDYKINVLACYVKEGWKEKAEQLAENILIFWPEQKELVDNLISQLK